MKVLKALSREQQAGLAVLNLAFMLIFLFGYSALSLLSLFVSFLVLTGIMLHLLFLATSEDDYQYKFKAGAASQTQAAKKLPLEERDEFIAPRTIFNLMLGLYRVVCTVVLEYRNLERARNVKHTARFLAGLPIAIFVIYYFGISDAFIEFAQPRLNIATKPNNLKIGARPANQSLPP